MNIEFVHESKKGLKKFNEDSLGYYFNKKLNLYLFCVADGIGGYEHGKRASELVINSVIKDFRNLKIDNFNYTELLYLLFDNANSRLHRCKCLNNINSCGTTLSILLISESHSYFANIGDTRIYSLKDGVIEQKSYDHTLANEFKTEYNRNILTKALTGNSDMDNLPFILKESLNKDSIFLITTDGLYNSIDLSIIEKLQNLSLDEINKKVMSMIENRDDATLQMIKVF